MPMLRHMEAMFLLMELWLVKASPKATGCKTVRYSAVLESTDLESVAS